MGVKLLCGQFAFNASAVLTGNNDGSVAVYNLRGFEQHPDDHVTITPLIAKSVGLNVLISFKQYIFSQELWHDSNLYGRRPGAGLQKKSYDNLTIGFNLRYIVSQIYDKVMMLPITETFYMIILR